MTDGCDGGPSTTAGPARRVRPSSRPGADGGAPAEPGAPDGAARRRFRLRLGLIALGALAFRVAYVLVLKRDEIPVGDQIYYSAQAVTIAHGGGFGSPFPPGGPAADHAPFTAAALALVSWWQGGASVLPQRLAMAVAGALVVVGIGALGRRLLGDRAGLVAAAIAAAYGAFWLNDVVIMSETFTAGVVVALLLATYAHLERPRAPTAVALGLLTGFAGLVRAELLVAGAALAIGAALAEVRSARRGAGATGAAPTAPARALGRLALAGACAVAVVAPWVGFNLARFESPTLISTQDGQTIAGANCDATYSGPGLGFWNLACADAVAMPEGLDQSERSVLQRRAGLEHVRTHLGDVPRVVAARLGLGLSVHGVERMVEWNVGEGRGRWGSRIALVQWWILAPLALVGLRRWPSGAPRWPLVTLGVLTAVTLAVVYGIPRFRVPFEVVVAVAAAVPLSRLRRPRWVRGGRPA